MKRPLLLKAACFCLLLIAAVTEAQLSIVSSLGRPPYEVGSKLTLTCRDSSGVSIESYNWTADCSSECFSQFSDSSLQSISTEDRITVPVLTSVDNGVYTCSAQYVNGSVATANLTVNVSGINVYELTDALIVNDNTSFVADANGNLTIELHCIGAEGPGNWTAPNGLPPSKNLFDVSEMYGSDILSAGLNPFTNPDQEGYYTCTATDEFGIESDIEVGLFLNEPGPPLNISLQSNTNPILLDSVVVLICSVYEEELVSPRPVYTWTLNGQPLDYNTSTISFRLTDVSQYGTYVCNASNPFGSIEEEINIAQAFIPQITVNNSAYTVNENSSVTFRCLATGVPEPVITWYRNGTVINDGGRYSLSNSTVFNQSTLVYEVNGSLQLTNASDTDADTNYRCTASNEAGNDTDTFSLIVNFGTRLLTAPVDQVITEFNSITFTCTVSGYERPTIQWRYSNTALVNGNNNVLIQETVNGEYTLTSILTLTNASRSVAGEYQCIGINTLNTVNAAANLTVNFVPDITESPDNITVIQPNVAQFNCSADGVPRPTISWIRNGTALSSDQYSTDVTSNTGISSRLVISSTTPLDTGEYICAISNSVKDVSTSAYLTVYVRPAISSVMSAYTVNETSSVTFQCIATGVPEPVITWYRNGIIIVDTRYSSSIASLLNSSTLVYQVMGSLQLTNASDTDADTNYACTASNGAGSDTDTFSLIVNFGTRLLAAPVDQVITESDDITFNCTVSGYERPTIQWRYSNTALVNGNNNVLIQETVNGEYTLTSILTLTNVSRSVAGEYKCFGTNTLNTVNAAAILTVNFVPDIIEFPENMTVIQPDVAQFNCSANGLPRPSISWIRNGAALSSDQYSTDVTSNTSISSRLVISSTTPLDTGEYICAISNSVKDVNTSAYLTVHVRPAISSVMSTYTVNENSSVTFQCSATGVPEPVITWYRNGAVINDGGRYSSSIASSLNSSTLVYQVNGSLIINQAYDSDSDTTYRCNATNVADISSDQFELDVLIAPVIIGPPSNFTVIQPNNVSFTCVTTGHPRSTVQWYRQTESTNSEIVRVTNGDHFVIRETSSGDRLLSSTLTINGSIPSDVGSYTCEANNVVTGYNNTASLIVHVTPNIFTPVPDQLFVVNESSSISIVCSATGLPAPSISWYRESLLLDGGLGSDINSRISFSDLVSRNYDHSDGVIYQSNQMLTLQANGTDTGTFTCNATNVVTAVAVDFRIFVQVLPVVVPLDGDRHIIGIEDKVATISFRIDNAAPPVSTYNISWLFSSSFSNDITDAQNITDLSTRIGDSIFSFSGNRLTLNISQINQTDEGRYFLLATNPAGQHYSHIDIIVHGPPYFIEKPSDATVINTEDISFTCSAIADPPHNVFWSFNDTNLPNTLNISSNDRYSINRDNSSKENFGRLTIHSAVFDDRGTYRCTVANYVGSLTASANLTVHVRPIVHSISDSISLLINSSLTLQCIATGYPLVNIIWKKNGELIPSNSPNITMTTQSVIDLGVSVDPSIPDGYRLGSIGRLVFQNVTHNDTANYTCVAENILPATRSLSDESDPTSVTVLERPDPPIDIRVIGYFSRNITVSWTPAFNGNRPIIGYFLYQKDLDRNEDIFVYSQPTSDHFFTTQTETSFTITSGIIPYTKYQFTVVACNDINAYNCSNQGEPSDPVRINPDAPDSPPYNCVARPMNSTAMFLTWSTPLQPNGLIEYYTVDYYALASISGLIYGNSSITATVATSSNGTDVVVSDLLKATSYNFSLRAFTVVGGSPIAYDICSNFTLEDVPDQAPQNLATSSGTSTSIYVTWQPPDLFYRNGLITSYRIRYTTNQALPSEELIVGNQTFGYIANLSIFTVYSISVSAGTAVGFGVETSIVIRRTLNDTSSPPVGLRLVGTPGRTNITVTWNRPQTLNGIIEAYNIYYQPYKANVVSDPSYDPSERRLLISSIPANQMTTTRTLTDLYPNSTYTISVTAINGAGESSRSDSVSANTQSSPPPPPEVPVIPDDGVGGRTVRITLVKPSTINGLISHYQVIAVLVSGDMPPSTPPDELFPSLDSFNTYDEIQGTSDINVGYIAAEFGADLFPADSMYTVGDPHEPHDRDYYNGPLRYGSSFTFFLRAYPLLSTGSSSGSSGSNKRQISIERQYTEFTSSNYTVVIATATDPAPAIAGSVVTVLLVIIIVVIVTVVIVVVLYRRRTGKLTFVTKKDRSQDILSMTSELSMPSIPNPAYLEADGNPVGYSQQYEGHPPISVGEFGKIVDRLHANDNYMFSQEYDDICRTSPQPSVDVCLNPMNKLRNRYANIQCYDHTRVKLTPVEDFPHDYINANFIRGYNRPDEYIATQGPLPDTVGDFWRMIWDYKCPTVVMLTNLTEKMRVKCSQYWPDKIGEHERFGHISVTLTKLTSHADYCIRDFEIQVSDQKVTRQVKQYHYTSWPDFGVPRNPTPVIQFIRTIRRHHKYSDSSPMVVHCSAGVGRTGTLITIDCEMQRAEHENEVNPYQFVRSMRENRNHMVQTEGQYIFLHDALLEILTTGWSDISIEQLEARMGELEIETEEGETGYLQEFNRLNLEKNHFDDFTSARNDANKFKNRIHNALPYDHNRVKLIRTPGEIGSDYINASFIDGYKAKNVFIATQGPMPETVNDFWRMICEHKVSVIVMLSNIEERGQVMSVQYWPEKRGEEIKFGSVTVHLDFTNKQEDYIHRQMKITYTTRDTSETRLVHQFNFTAWPRAGAPANGAGMIDLIDQVTKRQQQTGNKPILVHCSAGIGRTGAFCALSIAIERVKTEQLLNVYSIVKHLRTQRANMVQTLDQYIFIYRAVLDYVHSLDTYDNFNTLTVI